IFQRQIHCRFIRQRKTILNCRQYLNELPKESTSTNCRFLWVKHNARLRGWQRITTKLKHNNSNYRGSLGLETPRVDSPS
ncbi:hypothetical protein D0B82_18825, partial [Vibrio cholerae]|nr:hypothetical protein [Vibrio cholerae]